MGYVEVARVEEIPVGSVRLVEVAGRQLALVNVDGELFAVDNECTHRGGWMSEGELNADWGEHALECPLHGSVFDVRTGEVLNPPAQSPLRGYPVEVDGGAIKVLVE